VVDPETGRWIDSHIMNQDFVAWVGQGRIADRTREHLGESDRGVLMMRRRMFEQLEVVGAGGDPVGIIRDPAANHRVHLPLVGAGERVDPATGPPRFPFLAGQPQEIVEELAEVWDARARRAVAR
jgi:5,5'-dehydrodivanillate O-demethylase